jgi:hypothetical protein
MVAPGERTVDRLSSFKHAGSRFLIALLMILAILDFPVIVVLLIQEAGKSFVEGGQR